MDEFLGSIGDIVEYIGISGILIIILILYIYNKKKKEEEKKKKTSKPRNKKTIIVKETITKKITTDIKDTENK